MSKCARPGCDIPAKCSCSVCAIEQYCGSICQKLDWKTHKSLCPMLKKLSKRLQPFHEVERVLEEILATKKGREDTRLLEQVLTYAEYQFGKEIPKIGYRERVDGERIDNWTVDIRIFFNINSRLNMSYHNHPTLSYMICCDMRYRYLERSVGLLKPWLVHLDSLASHRIDGLENC
jgi:hypothetical protein